VVFAAFVCVALFLSAGGARAAENPALPRPPAGQSPAQNASAPAAPSASSPIERAEQLFAGGKYEESLALFDEILKNAFITQRDRAYALCRKGLILSLRRGFSESQAYLEQSLSSGGLSEDHQSTCTYALLQLYVLKGNDEGALQLIESLGRPSFAPIYQARVWALGAETARRRGDTAREVVYLERLLRIMETRGIRNVALKILGKRVVSFDEVRSRLGRDEGTAGGAAAASAQRAGVQRSRFENLVLFMRKTLDATQTGQWTTGEQRWKVLVDRDLAGTLQRISGFTPELARMVERMAALRAEQPSRLRVGILVPSELELAGVSHRILRAASAFLASPASNGVQIQPIVRGAPADAGAIEQAVLKLVSQDLVHVIIGPVSSALTIGAIKAAEMFGVPVFALGPVADSPALRSDFLVRMGILAESQTTALVDHLQQSRLRNAAIMAPNDAYGVEMARSFSRIAAKKSFPVEKVTFYDVNTDVFAEAVSHALGPQDAETRRDEYAAAARELRKRAFEQKRKFDPSEIKLPALVRFDALFLPDSLRKARVISSTFAFQDARHIRFLGDKQWAEGDRRRSIADEFLNGSRVPYPVDGRYLNHLLLNLEVRDPQFQLDIERQVFDALILTRQAHYLAGGVNGHVMARRLRNTDWKVEGTTHISGVTALGEPLTQYTLRAYSNGALVMDLPDWTSDRKENAVVPGAQP
jgi:tetratricopeptide (TPR) repeat protein